MPSRSIVLDTNVLISGALKENSNPAEVLKLLLTNQVTLITCPSIVAEYRNVFNRPRFKKWNFPPIWLDEILKNAIHLIHDPKPWPLKGPDNSDLIFLSLANQQGATLITGNIKDFPTTIRQHTEIFSPKDYLLWIAESN